MSRFPEPDAAVSTILVVADAAASARWYEQVLGAVLFRTYGGTTAVLQLQGTWLVLVIGGGPTSDKPGVTMAEPDDPSRVSHSFTIRVEDCRGTYDALRARGAEFLTPPADRESEIRCFFRDPDGHLFEFSQSLS
jgi:catechol 2,3-dioxygenase-like lactoylglutathione lyase family enzyme